MLTLLAVLIGLIIGFCLKTVISKNRPIGVLRIDRSDATFDPLLFLELDTDVNQIIQKQYVTFKVKCEDIFPHK